MTSLAGLLFVFCRLLWKYMDRRLQLAAVARLLRPDSSALHSDVPSGLSSTSKAASMAAYTLLPACSIKRGLLLHATHCELLVLQWAPAQWQLSLC